MPAAACTLRHQRTTHPRPHLDTHHAMVRGILISLFCVSWLSVCAQANSDKYRAAARCIALNAKCTKFLADRSMYCEPKTYVKKQNETCLKNACSFCASGGLTKLRSVCNSWAIRHWCFGDKKKDTKGRPSPMPSSAGNTVSPASAQKPSSLEPKMQSTGTGSKVIICLANKKPKSPWVRKGSGLIWRPTEANKRDPEGSGEMCFNFKPPKTGNYYLSAVTSAPHRVDNNDMWIKLSSGLWLVGKNMQKKDGGSGYLKAYQNVGSNAKAYIISNVDHDPHQFLTNSLQAGSVQTLCMSGRSSRFTVYKFILVHCAGAKCDRKSDFIKDAMKGMTSTCSN